jgi:hypothetical protein
VAQISARDFLTIAAALAVNTVVLHDKTACEALEL